MYKKVDVKLNFLDREKEVLEFWDREKVFDKSVDATEGGREFTFYDGPPTANGKPHIGHVLTRVMKDIVPRYKTMKGFHVLRKAGWDTHGLPVELEIEKKLGLDGKQDIERFGIEPFIGECKQSVWKYTTEWKNMSDRLAYWVDMDNPYVTYHDDYIESVWWALKTISDKGLLYKGYKIVPYCPRCGTALSSHEVAQGYKDVKEKSVYVKFKLKGEENVYFLAWTTTPWTLPSNVALCMNAEFDYVKIKSGEEYYILAKSLVDSLFDEYQLIDTKKGKDYEFVEYEPLFPFAVNSLEKGKKAYFVVLDDYVTADDGTGIVHNAPAFGEDDSRVCKKYDVAFINLVDARGRLTEECEKYAGLFVKDADKVIIKDLAENGSLFKVKEFEHSYPFCWRCNTPLIYYARSSWFIKTTAIKDQLIASNNSVNWMPETIKSGRMGNFLENVIDWGLSRERYWGTPLPVWVCDDCGEFRVFGSKQEMKDACGVQGDIELHRPYIDKPTCTCHKCGGTMRRVKDVIDCWFDSGSMPFAQYHYPFENKELFEKHFPADFISEAIDQTRGWFYTLLTISTLLFGKAPFKNCIVLGHVNDAKGIKMSKHLGNVVDPWTVLNKQGADAVRWYFYTSSAPWLPSRFSEKAVSECQAKYMGTLWNAYAFFVLYADIDNYDPSKYDLKSCKLTVMDKWLLSRLNSLIAAVDKGLEEYKVFESARLMQTFVDELSNWYIRRSRERFWGSGMTEDKAAAYTTLWTTLVTFAKLTAPFTPFIAESIYLNLVPQFFADAPESVHLCKFPTADESFIDEKLEADMDRIEKIVVLGRSARNLSNIKNRQPLKKLYFSVGGGESMSEELFNIARDELNVKEFEYLSDSSSFISFKLKPQLKTLGPKYGKLLGAIKNFLDTCDADAVVKTVKSNGQFVTTLNGEEVVFTENDLLISTESKQGFVSASEDESTVVLDVNLTPELIDEGYVREIVSKIQTMRKEADFVVTDRIRLYAVAEKPLIDVIEKYSDKISSSVLAESVVLGQVKGYVKEWDINGEVVTFGVEQL